MSDEVALALISLVSTVVTILARRVHQNTMAMTGLSDKFETLLRALSGESAK